MSCYIRRKKKKFDEMESYRASESQLLVNWQLINGYLNLGKSSIFFRALVRLTKRIWLSNFGPLPVHDSRPETGKEESTFSGIRSSRGHSFRGCARVRVFPAFTSYPAKEFREIIIRMHSEDKSTDIR